MATTNKVTMQLQGMEALQRKIKEAPKDVREWTADAIQKTTFADYQRVIAKVNRITKTGRLKRNISIKYRGLYGRILVGPDAYYWRFIEYGFEHRGGTSIAANPIFRSSTDEEAPSFLDRITRIAKNLERAWGAGGGVGI